MKKYIKAAVRPLLDEEHDTLLELAKSPEITADQAADIATKELSNNLDILLSLYLNPVVPQSIKDSLKVPKYVIVAIEDDLHYGYGTRKDWAYRVCDNDTEDIAVSDDSYYNKAYWYKDALEIADAFEEENFATSEEFIQVYSAKYSVSVLINIWNYMNTHSTIDTYWNYYYLLNDIIHILYPKLPITIEKFQYCDEAKFVFYNKDTVDSDILEDYFDGRIYDVNCCEIVPECLNYLGEKSWFWMYDNGVIYDPNSELMAFSEYESMSKKDLAKLFKINPDDFIVD